MSSGRQRRKAAIQHGLAGRNDLHHRRHTGFEVGLDRANQGGCLHARDDVAEEPLLDTLKSTIGGRLRGPIVHLAVNVDNIGGLQRRTEIVMNHLKSAAISVINLALLRRQGVLDNVVVDTLE